MKLTGPRDFDNLITGDRVLIYYKPVSVSHSVCSHDLRGNCYSFSVNASNNLVVN